MARLQTSPAQLILPSFGLESSHAAAAPSFPDEVCRDDVLPVQGGFRLGLMSNPLGSDSDFGGEASREDASEEAASRAPGSWSPGPPGRPENGSEGEGFEGGGLGEEGSKEEASEEAFSLAPGFWCPGPPGRPENGTFDQVNKVVDVAHGVLASTPGSAGGACRCPSSFWTRKWTLQLEDAGGRGLLGLLRAAVRRGLSRRRRGRVHERLAFLSCVLFFICVPASRCGVL